MITLRTVEIETEKDADSLITNLQWHTERLRIIPLNFFHLFFRINVSRRWLGQIDREKGEFKLLRNKGQSEFGLRLSGIVIKGQMNKESNKTLIKINLQPTGYIFLNNAILTIVTVIGAVLIPIEILTKFWWAFAIWIMLLMSNFVFLAIDLSKTERKLIEYFNSQTTS